jgi:tetratricopeptide (TPR) repeat protein
MNQNTLSRAVAIAMCDGPEAGLAHIDAVLEHGELANYYLAHSARADMYRRLGRTAEARASYEKALALTQQEPERQFLQERIRQLKYKRLVRRRCGSCDDHAQSIYIILAPHRGPSTQLFYANKERNCVGL